MMDYTMIYLSMFFIGASLVSIICGAVESYFGHAKHRRTGIELISIGAIGILLVLSAFSYFNYEAFWDYITALVFCVIGLGIGVVISGAVFLILRPIK